MSLQDDYYDLASELRGEDKKALDRIWLAFCEYENEALVANGEVSQSEMEAFDKQGMFNGDGQE